MTSKKREIEKFKIELNLIIKDNQDEILCLASIAHLMQSDSQKIKELLLIGNNKHPQYKNMEPWRGVVKTLINGNLSRLRQTGRMNQRISESILMKDFNVGIESSTEKENYFIARLDKGISQHHIEPIIKSYDTKTSK